ncbi:MAG TPA: hypothetical protein VEZ55_07345 [Chitinophagaceae bacterium]|nr:hypothetical protein [Chitinophagaceae bacterium]
MKHAFISILFLILANSCTLERKEKMLQQKEAALIEKEQSLNLKERELQLLEEDLRARENKVDSSAHTDSAVSVNTDIVGSWTAKMVCSETTCPGSAVGDTKTEQWDISYQNNRVIAKAVSSDKMIRLYTGSYNGNVLELTEEPNGNTTQRAMSMLVRLRITDKKTLEGQREIIREGDCKIIYSVQLTKQ